ncbi:hypothetical protein [Nocardia brevicatena]|uniref:hypothetical protein n=1 Tax=Nocardia brevicatena TaxID=37327 RepID=UPI0003090870|nr:hypothetical protein [Nocardia brevicatena]
MAQLLRQTKTYRRLTVYRYLAFNLPKVTTALGILLLLGIAAVHLYLIGTTPRLPAYLAGYFAVLGAGCLIAAVTMTAGRFARRGRLVGSLVSTVFLVVYLLARFTGLPMLPEVENWWDFTPGTIAIGCAALFLATHVSVLLGINVAHPQKRDWHD